MISALFFRRKTNFILLLLIQVARRKTPFLNFKTTADNVVNYGIKFLVDDSKFHGLIYTIFSYQNSKLRLEYRKWLIGRLGTQLDMFMSHH